MSNSNLERQILQKSKYLPNLLFFDWCASQRHSKHKMKLSFCILKADTEDNFLILKSLSFGFRVQVNSFFLVTERITKIFITSNLRRLRREKILTLKFGHSILYSLD